MMEALSIIAQSWPIAVMVVGVGAAIVLRRCFKQAADNAFKMSEYRSSSAVVVRSRDEG